MRYISKFLILLFFTCLSTTLFAQIPTIISFSPTSGPVGSAVTITGTNFSTTPANNVVWFGAVKATVTSATSTSLSVNVPVGATYQPISVTTTLNGLTAYSAKPFLVTFSSTNVIDATAFSAKVDFSSGSYPYNIASGDIDGDGKPDLIVANQTSNSISVYRNTSTSGSLSSGSLATKVDFATGSNPTGLAIADIDGDGKQDIAVTNSIGGSVSIFRNTSSVGAISSGSLATKVDFLTGTSPYGITITDFDSDGKPDMAITNETSNTLSIFRNTAVVGSITTGSFAAKVDFVTVTHPYGVSACDIDGDSRFDIVITNIDAGSLSIFKNTSTSGSITSGSFAPKVDFTTGTMPYGIAIADIDCDDKPDLAVSNYSGNTISVYRNVSTSGSITTSSLAPRVDFSSSLAPGGIAIGDLTGDGKPDIAVSNFTSNTISVFKNLSTPGSISANSFSAKIDFSAGSNPYDIIIIDLDGDGRPDVGANNWTGTNISLFRNAISNTGLVAWYPFNGNANDASGNGNNGTVSGATLTSDRFGNPGTAITTGNSKYVQLPSNLMNGFTSGTVSLFFKSNGLPSTAAVLIDKSITGSINYYQLRLEPDGKIFSIINCAYGETPVPFLSTISSVNPNQWNHLVFTWDGSIWKIYLNGILNGTFNSPKTIPDISSPVFLGKTDSGSNIFDGSIDDFRIYNRALSETEVDNLYNEGDWPLSAPVRDIDGNTYDTVRIGTQTWMKQNLKTTKYNDGTSIPNVTDNTAWGALTTPGYSWYNNDAATYKNSFGGLYNWYAVNTGKLCPTGWHVPTSAEWTTLENYMTTHGYNYDGSMAGNLIAKSLASVTGWNSSTNVGSPGNTDFPIYRNKSDFTALPAGVRTYYGAFMQEGINAYFWLTDNNPRHIDFDSNSLNANNYLYKVDGFSVRCLKDGTSSGLVASYPFNGNANDESGNGNNGTINGATPADDRFGKLNNAYNFNGASNINLGNTHPTSINNFSLSVWFNVRTISSIPFLLHDGLAHEGFTTLLGNDNTLIFQISKSLTEDNTLVIPFGQEQLNKWHHVVFISDGGTIRLYLDGTLMGTNSGVTGISGTNNLIAGYDQTANSHYLDGLIDDIRLFNKVLTSNEVSNLYHENGWPKSAPVIDIDGNTYDTVKIGTQTWMKQNLKTTKFNDGTSIPNVIDNTSWGALSTPGYCWYNNDEAANKNIYGALYNWYAINTGKICPTGWHVPSNYDWGTLSSYLGGGSIAGGKLKETGTSHWNSPNTAATNESGFTALPGGSRDFSGTFNGDIGIAIQAWSSADANASNAYYWGIAYNNGSLGNASYSKKDGFSIRCIKDDLSLGLKASYPFNGNTNDESGNGNNGTISGAVLATDRLGNSLKAYNLNGDNSNRITLSPFIPPEIISISIWIHPFTIGTYGLTASTIFSNNAKFVNHDNIALLQYNGQILFYITNSSGIGTSIYSDNQLSINQWHHIVITIDELKLCKMYIDDVLQTQTATWSGTYIGQSTTNIGNFPSDDDNFDGILDDLKIYNRALVSTEVDELFHENGWGLPPSINSFTPTSGPIGTTVTITGSNFDPIPANNIVWFGAVKASVSSATETELVVTVPAGASYQPISVTTTLNGLTGFSKKQFNVTFPSSQIIDIASYSSPVSFPTVATPQYSAVSDIDGDGKPDLIYGGSSASSSVSVRRNTSVSGSLTTGSFAASVDLSTGTNTNPIGISVADIDGDGLPDIVAANYNTNTVSVFRNISTPGNIAFDPRVDFATASTPHIAEIVDVDSDGKPDIAAVCWNGNVVSVLRNTSVKGSITSGSFAPKVDFAAGNSPRGITSGDFNNDGKTDLAVTNHFGNSISIFINTSISGTIDASSFEAKIDFGTATQPCGITTGDIDGDGNIDILVANYGSNSVSAFRNIYSSGSFTGTSLEAKTDYSVGSFPMYAFLSDIDGDGKADIIADNAGSSNVSVLKNKSTSGTFNIASFSTKTDFSVTVQPAGLAVGDLDGDGKPDIVTANNPANTLSVLRNQITAPPPTITSFNPASGTIGSSVTITGTNFDPVAANNIVWFGAVKATVNTSTSTSLSVTVPTGATYQPITVTVNGLTAYSAKPFNVTFPNSSIIDATSFAAKVDLTCGVNPESITIGDIDLDGKPDIITANVNSNSFSVFRNISTSGSITNGSFATKSDFATGIGPRGITIGDVDGDGKADVIVANLSSNTISVFRNTSTSGSITTGSFATKVDFATGANPYSVTIGDIDGDGKPDIVTTNGNNTISIFRNTSTSGSISTDSFSAKLDISTGSNPFYSALSDLDEDGKPDLVVTNWGSNSISVFKNSSTPGSLTSVSFSPKVDFVTGQNPIGIVIGDIDGDSKPDLSVTNYTSNTVSIFRNTSFSGIIEASSFSSKVDFSTGSGPYVIAIGDINGDGKPGLVTANHSSNTVSVFLNTSTLGSIGVESFASKIDYATGITPFSVAIGDLDGDGIPDIVTANNGSNTISVLRNKITSGVQPPTIISFTPTSGPIGTTVTITGTNFSTTPANNIVWFGAVKATVNTATSTSLSVTVPTGATYQPVTVTVNGLTAYSAKPFNVTFPGPQIIDVSSFNLPVTFSAGSKPDFVALGDIDGDGKSDIIFTNALSSTLSVLRNISSSGSINSGSFATKVDFSTGTNTNPLGIATGDIDGDGKLDLAVANNATNTVSLFRNTSSPGTISFAAREDIVVGTSPNRAVIVDIDSDGRPDLAVLNGNSITVHKNNCSPGSITAGSFGTLVDFVVGGGPRNIAAGDIDGDNKPDLIASSTTTYTMSVFRNTGITGIINTASLAPKVDITTDVLPTGVAIADLDGDGKSDIFVVNSQVDKIQIFKNISTPGSFTTGSIESNFEFTTGTYPESIAIVDLDGDGKPDVFTGNSTSNSASVFKNTSSLGILNAGSLAAKIDFTTSSPACLVAGDLDGDQKPDLVVANGAANTISVFRNNIQTVSAPTIGTITHPTCTVATGSVVLNGLPASGTWTLTRSPGNVITTGSGTSTTITGLAAGTYTYTVTNSVAITSGPSGDVVINSQPPTPSTPVVGTITHPTCSVATGTVILNGLPATGTWTLTRSPGGITTTGTGTTTTISSLTAGTYTFTVTNASSCISVASSDVIINSQPSTPTAPVVGAITHPTCAVATGSVVLSGLPSSGTWTITQSPGGVITNGTGTSTTISSLGAGTYRFTVTNASSCISAQSADVVINPQANTPTAPTVGTITQPTCSVSTGSVELSDLPATGSWTLTRLPDGATTNGSGTSIIISGIAAGSYTYTVTNASACISVQSAAVVINAQPVTPSAPVVGTITQPTCSVASGSIQLTGLPSTGNWTITTNPGGTTSSGSGTTVTLSGIAAGTYTYTVTNASGCISVASAGATVNTQPSTPTAPVVGTITHPTCSVSTGSVVLSGLPAGTWTLTRSPGGTTTGNTATTTISDLEAGTYTFTVTNASSCTSPASSEITINPQPATPSSPIVGTITQPSCATSTGSVVLSGIPTTGSWVITRSPGGTTTSVTGPTTTISGIPAGSYTFTINNAGTCMSLPSSTVVIDAQPVTPAAPAIGTITQPTCTLTTGSVVLSGLPSSGTWSLTRAPGGTVTTGTGTTTTISTLTPGTYSFTLSIGTGCTSSSGNVIINSVPIGIIPVIIKKWNDVLICTNLNNKIDKYQWYKGTTPLTGETQEQFYWAKNQPGAYLVLTTDKDGCKNYSNIIQIGSGSKSLTAFPNPVRENVTIDLNDEPTGKAVISVFSETGVKVLEFETEKEFENLLHELSVETLDEGIYFIRVTVDKVNIYSTKIVVAK